MKFQSNYDHPVTLFVGSAAIRFNAHGVYETDDPGVIEALKASDQVTLVREPKPDVKAEKPKVEVPPTKDKKGSVKRK